jgi:predicted ATPase/DNA-binding CsgD family transcriptional regulator
MLKRTSIMRIQKRLNHRRFVVQVPANTKGKEASNFFSPLSTVTRQTRTAPLYSSPLPTCSGQMIGREQDLQALTTLLSSPDVRLVTLTGMGGIGKTWLALHAATNLHTSFVDGIYFISLASIHHPDLLLTTIAQALGIENSNDQPLLEAIKHTLYSKRLLLLIDTMEHVVSAASCLTQILKTCPHLKILVTSRVELRLRGEHIYPVPPLTLPDLTSLPAYDDLLQYTAIVMFVQRVRTFNPGWKLIRANARTIAEICVHLDGLPLALELAAARMKLMSAKELLLRLRNSSSYPSTLTNEMRDVPTRHQTLHQNITWSYSLLTSQEQHILQKLSVLENSYSFTVIENVCGDGGESAQGTLLLDTVSSLIDHNLLQVRWEKEKEEPRFTMPKTIQAYAQKLLEESGENTATHQIHAAYYLAQAEEMEAGPTCADQEEQYGEDIQTEERNPSPLSSTPFHTNLTNREIEVLCLIAQGLTSLQIAQHLTITTLTVNSHVRSIYNKLGISTRSAATRYAIEQNLL